MKLSEEQLKELEKLGGLFFSINEAAIIMELDAEKLKTEIEDTASVIYKRYEKGRLQAEVLIRESVIDLAGRGSSQAQELARKYILEQKLKMIT